MATYLLTWNPSTSFSWDDLPAEIERFRSGESVSGHWSFGNRRSANVGDRVFLIKQGSTRPKGIVAAGYITEEPFQDQHWNRPNESANYVGIEWDALLDPSNEPILERHALNEPGLEEMHWDSQSSGIEIPEDIAERLEQAWRPFANGASVNEPQFGALKSVPPGTIFANRKEVSDAWIHRPLQAGIWGTGATGAYSIVLSGGYVDDRDYGDEIIYTGQGGRDQQSGRQIFHQELTRGNLALAKNHTDGLPVRVVRGYQHRSTYSPASGYRYDGLYRVDEYWKERGEDNFEVWRFRLIKIESDDAPGESTLQPTLPAGSEKPEKKESIVLRTVRNTNVCQAVKALYDYRCQVCGVKIETPAGPYAEGAHIRPLGWPHNGSDRPDNILCLCPNHHVMFDNFVFTISDDLQLIGIASPFNVQHEISIANIRYHREHRYKCK